METFNTEQVSGILEILSDGYGFLRGPNYLPTQNDIYVSPSQIKGLRLRTGDVIAGVAKEKNEKEKFQPLIQIDTINRYTVKESLGRGQFENMTPIFPNKKLKMETAKEDTAMRIVDILSPVGKGQRGMIISPPKAGKTTLLKNIANSIIKNNKDIKMIILLIDERPEEVTDIKESIIGTNVDVIYSTFDETPEHHKRVAEMALERAKRLVEHGEDVVVLLDSITRLARAYNLIVPQSGKTLSGGLDPSSLYYPKRFFGAARNMREGGSLTILATALVDTGSKMDDVIYEEFKGTGNMELVLNRDMSEKRVFPAIDIYKSGTRRDDLILSKAEYDVAGKLRHLFSEMKTEEATERTIQMFDKTKNNKELIALIGPKN